jgi:hypothetical protein
VGKIQVYLSDRAKKILLRLSHQEGISESKLCADALENYAISHGPSIAHKSESVVNHRVAVGDFANKIESMMACASPQQKLAVLAIAKMVLNSPKEAEEEISRWKNAG